MPMKKSASLKNFMRSAWKKKSKVWLLLPWRSLAGIPSLSFKSRRFLKIIIANNQPVVSQNSKSSKALLQKNFGEYCHVYDVYLTSIFNFHCIFPGRYIDICLLCYNNWLQPNHMNRSMKKSGKRYMHLEGD
ncbi:hypothetical protein K501DRAFT_267550 [Backusella circina FSU 941]|nr:hypothetical protein K501DRAFT_267550 [Backusella circina FSU 941]